MGVMDTNIDLKYVFETYPETEKNIKKLSAILRDLYPCDVRERNLIEAAYNTGVASHIKKSSVISSIDLQNYSKQLEDNYGISKQFSNLAVKLWADAYSLGCPFFSIKEIEEDNAELYVVSSLARFNNVIWENEDIRVVYKGLDLPRSEDEISSFWLNISLSNKTDRVMHVKFINMRINEDVIKDKSSEIFFQPKIKNQIEQILWGDTKDLLIIGIHTIDDIKSLSFEVMYSYKKYFKHEEAVGKSNVVYIEPYYI